MSITKVVDFSSHRLENESFDEYKERRKIIGKLLKIKKKGDLVYSPKELVQLPEIVNGQVMKDENGNIKYTDKKIKIGSYVKKIFGEMNNFIKLSKSQNK